MGTPALRRFEVDGGGKAFTLRIEDDRGNILTVTASRDQLDVIADALDDVLLTDDAADEPDDA